MALPNIDEIPPDLPGEDQTLSWIAWSLQQVADNAATASQQLNNAKTQLQWTGLAADQFINALGDLPDHLNKISLAYGAGARAVKNYVGNLDTCRGSWRFNRARFGDALDEYYQAQTTHQDTSPAEDTGNQILRNLDSLWSEASFFAAQLSSRLNDAAGQGDTNGVLNTIERYGGDVGGFAIHMVTNVVNAAVDLATTAVQLIKDVAAGDWGAVLKDLHQMLSDLNQILTALLPILQFIPGVGEIVDIIEVVVLVVSVALVASDLVEGGIDVAEHGWGYALSNDGGQLFGDSLNLVTNRIGAKDDEIDSHFKALYGGDKPEAGSLAASMRSEKGWVTRYTNQGDADAAAAAQARLDHLSELQTRIASMPDTPSYTSLADFRSSWSNMKTGQNALDEALQERNPIVSNPFGINITYKQYKVVTTGIENGIDTGKSIHSFVQDPNADSGKDLGKTMYDDVTAAQELK